MSENIETDIKVSVIIVAAGSGKRMKSKTAKQFIEIKNKPVVAYTIDKFENVKEVQEIIIVTGKNDIEFFKNNIIDKYSYKKVKAIIEGGSERQYSVLNGLKQVDPKCDIVLIHDGVRPFIKKDEILNIIKETLENDCCVLGVKVKDTIKFCDENGIVVDTPKRDLLWAAQTPQAFKYDIIMKVHKKVEQENFLGTDDAMLVERMGYKIKMVEGSYDNIKITTPEDLIFAEKLI